MTAPFRVLHCLWRGDVGGAERAVYQLMREQMRDPEVEPAILFGRSAGSFWSSAASVTCPVLELQLPGQLASPRHLRGAASAMRPRTIHHFHSMEPVLMAASAACRGARRIYTRRAGSFEPSLKRRLRYAAGGILLRTAFHGFSGNTRHAARETATLLGRDAADVLVTYNGLEFDLLDPVRPREAVRKELGAEPGHVVLGTTGGLKALKRMDRLVRAVAAIPDSRLRLVIVGDGPERTSLEALADQFGVAHRVVFTGQKLQVGDYLHAMDIFSLPSGARESFGNSLVEAMAVGLPSIVFSDSAGLLEHVEDGGTAVVVADQAGLEDAIRRMLGDPLLRARLGSAARADVRERYTPQRAAEAYKRLYRLAG